MESTQATTKIPVGTFDFLSDAAKRFEIINRAMQSYFEAENWIEAKNKKGTK